MLDIKFVRENPEIVKQNIKNKFQDSKLPLVDESSNWMPRLVRPSRRQMSFAPIVIRFQSRSVL